MKKLTLLAIVCLLSLCCNSQITTNSGFTAQQLAEILASSNITITNASITGNASAYGTFNGVNSNVGVNSGVILSTGNIQNAAGPNNQDDVSGSFNLPGDPILDSIAQTNTMDAVILQFDFQVQSDAIEFNYVFASEEYPEFAPPNGGINDVFTFFISGPGIVGEENIALVPNTTDPVSINTINAVNYWQYYIDNDNGATVQYDGFTIPMVAKKENLIPCQTYTLKLMIADAQDDMFDSAVMLEENSLIQAPITAFSNTVSTNNTASEGCTDASFTFELEEARPFNTDVYISVGGSAINGVDYEYIDSVFTIPSGQKKASIIIKAIADGLDEGQETVEISYRTLPCSDPQTVMLFIDDTKSIEYFVEGVDANCFADSTGQIIVHLDSAQTNVQIVVNDLYTYNDTLITGLPPGNYQVKVNDEFGCGGEAIVIGAKFDADTTFLPDGNGNIYTSDINITGFAPGQTLDDISMFQSICAKMEHSYLGDLEIKLIAPNGSEVILKERPGGNHTNLGEPVAKGKVDGANSDVTPGVGYDYCFTLSPTFGTMVSEKSNYSYSYVDNVGKTLNDNYLPAGSYESYEPLSKLLGTELNGTWTLSVQDQKPQDNGYIFDWSISFAADRPGDQVTIGSPSKISIAQSGVQPACGDSTGSISVTATGDVAIAGYSWNLGEFTTQNLTNIPAGNYHLVVTDLNGCKEDTTFGLSSLAAFTLTGSTTDQTCYNTSTGIVDLVVGGATGNVSYTWSNGDTTIGLTNVNPGIYSVEAIDESGCLATASYEVFGIDSLRISLVNLVNESCGKEDGLIEVGVTGGRGPYSYSWNNGDNTALTQYLQAGQYTVTVTDSSGCSNSATFNIVNEVSACVVICDLVYTGINVVDEQCGNQSGSIDISVAGGTQPYNYSWSNSVTTQDLNGLSAGSYILTVSDINQCQLIDTFNVVNNTSGLVVNSVSLIDENCGDQTGAINIAVSGGALPYSYLWGNGATTKDLANLAAGTYNLEITDANGCKLVEQYTISNNSGSLQQTYGSAFNEVCGDGTGSIDITISGGAGGYVYNWSNGVNTQDLINLSAGNYSCSITDAAGCTINTEVYQIDNTGGDLAIVDIDAFDEVCANGLGRIGLDVVGGSAPLTYSWSTGANSTSIIDLTEGTYSCVVSDQNGCSVSTGDITINNSSGLLTLENVTVVDETCGNGLGSIDLTISGATGFVNFNWSNGATSEDVIGLSENGYTCIIQDSVGCQLEVNANVLNSTGALSVDNIIVTNEQCGDSSGMVNLIVSGAAGVVNYTWNSGETTEDLTGLKEGFYSCQITDANGCSVVAEANVLNVTNAFMLDNVQVTNEVCGASDGAIDITIVGGQTPYKYTWSNLATSPDLNNLNAGTYHCIVEDNLGCLLNVGPIVVNNSAPAIQITSAVIMDDDCNTNSGSIDLTVSGLVSPTYSWSSGQNTLDISGVSAGDYEITITDQGCSTSQMYTVAATTGSLKVDNVVITPETCGNLAGSIDLTISGATAPVFVWSDLSGMEDLVGVAAGTYSCQITDGGCIVNTGDLVVPNDPGTLNLTDVAVTNETCGDSSGAISPIITGAVSPSYNWTSGQNTPSIANLKSGTYFCTVSDVNGCTLDFSGTVLNNSGNVDVFIDTVINQAYCGILDGEIQIVASGTGPLTYQWSNGTTNQNLIGLNSGNYTVTVQDSLGCSISVNAEVGQISDLIITSNIIDESCDGDNGSIDLNVVGGVSPYTYNWNTGANSQDLMGLAQGSYTVTVQDVRGCQEIRVNDVNYVENTIVIDALNIEPDYCGSQSGFIDLSFVSGGQAPYTYYLEGQDQFGPFIGPLFGGDYNVSIADVSGCQLDTVLTIEDVVTFTVTDTVIVDASCGTCMDGSIDLTVEPNNGLGIPPLLFYSWSNGVNTEDLFGVLPGGYQLTITDANNFGCEQILFLEVGVKSGVIEKENLTYTIYPNPTKGELLVSISSIPANDVKLSVYNVIGDIIETNEYDGNSSLLWEVDLTQQPNGVYFVKIQVGEESVTEKIILAR